MLFRTTFGILSDTDRLFEENKNNLIYCKITRVTTCCGCVNDKFVQNAVNKINYSEVSN